MDKILNDFIKLGKDIIGWFDVNLFNDIGGLVRAVGNFLIRFLELLITLIRWVIEKI